MRVYDENGDEVRMDRDIPISPQRLGPVPATPLLPFQIDPFRLVGPEPEPPF